MTACDLEDIPDSLCDLVDLKQLKLDCNESLTDLPLSLSLLTALKILKATFCDFRFVPEVLRHLSNLEQIGLGDSFSMQIKCSLSDYRISGILIVLN